MPAPKSDHGDLREACVREAMELIAADGIEGLSLRQVSRRLGVSHQAPYKHFASRDHLLAEIVRRAFEAFATALEERPRREDPEQDLAELGRAYFRHARDHALHYQLMFGTALPDAEEHPDMTQAARRAYAVLHEAIRALPGRASDEPTAIAHDSLFVWAAIHGLATILQSCAVDRLGLPEPFVAQAPEHLLVRLGTALGCGEHGQKPSDE
ncbi:MAG: TetR/AcrR family transcriptional regulator [Acidobacteriota bacterium]